jgi:hypothetical protein
MLSNVLESRLIKNCYNESHFSVSYGFVPICCESQFACPGQFRSNLLWVLFACLGQFCTKAPYKLGSSIYRPWYFSARWKILCKNRNYMSEENISVLNSADYSVCAITVQCQDVLTFGY